MVTVAVPSFPADRVKLQTTLTLRAETPLGKPVDLRCTMRSVMYLPVFTISTSTSDSRSSGPSVRYAVQESVWIVSIGDSWMGYRFLVSISANNKTGDDTIASYSIARFATISVTVCLELEVALAEIRGRQRIVAEQGRCMLRRHGVSRVAFGSFGMEGSPYASIVTWCEPAAAVSGIPLKEPFSESNSRPVATVGRLQTNRGVSTGEFAPRKSSQYIIPR